ncbi:MAG: aminotransferase class IV [Actinobacteria bacterium]|nr:aminotransferase class IV [Actinomycetota bacterium]
MEKVKERLAYVNGNFVSEAETKVSVYDSALMFGDMVFEMTRSFNGKQFKLREHLERLYRGIKELKIPLKETIDEMEELVNKTIEKNKPAFLPTDEHRIMIDISRGPLAMYSKIFNGKVEPTVIITDFPVKWTVESLAHFYDDGIHAVVPRQHAIPAQYLECKIKSRSRLHFLLANLEVSMLNDPNAWALLTDPDGFIAEGTGSNFFIVKDGRLITPEGRNILRGITRQYIMELALKTGIPVTEKNIELYDVINADEAFFTSAGISMLPCTKIQGLTIGDGKMGKITKKLIEEWSKEVNIDIIEQTKAFAAELGDELGKGTNIYKF